MIQLSNFHSHTSFCDGCDFPEKFVRFAISRHMRAYGFSAHAPLPFENFSNMSSFDLPEYLQEIERLKKKYRGIIELYVGLEIDFLDYTYNPSIKYFTSLPLDYRIGSVHFLPFSRPLLEENTMCIDGPIETFKSNVNEHFVGNIELVVKRYFDAVNEMIERGGFDIVGHMDKIFMNGKYVKGFNPYAESYLKLMNETFDHIAQKGLIVELNTKNLLCKNETYPHKHYISLFKKFRIPVMVNSDSHYPTRVDHGIREGLALLKAHGIDFTYELVDGEWTQIAI
ncbi:MAG: histidinol-phosphatase [Massilibacteroides sp.]|nr:histidinol-phosphatase [Massilibacteroides sp.]